MYPPVWRCLRREEAPAAAAKAVSKLLTPTLIRSWKAAMFTSQVYTQVFPLGCLPSIACDRCSGAGLWWHCCGAWAGDRAWLPIYCSSEPPTYTRTHAHPSSSLSFSPNHLKYTSLSYFSPKWCLLPLLILSQPTRLPAGCRIRLMMLLYGA